jgi:hypothetical protein
MDALICRRSCVRHDARLVGAGDTDAGTFRVHTRVHGFAAGSGRPPWRSYGRAFVVPGRRRCRITGYWTWFR